VHNTVGRGWTIGDSPNATQRSKNAFFLERVGDRDSLLLIVGKRPPLASFRLTERAVNWQEPHTWICLLLG
jgi:hypothetical protein